MNPEYHGDSFDIVKRFFCHELRSLGFDVLIDPMLTGEWTVRKKRQFQRLVGAAPRFTRGLNTAKCALFLDPDIGVNERGGRQYLSFKRLAEEATEFHFVFSFDQSFSRKEAPDEVMHRKLRSVQNLGCHGMYYNSHARFLFVSADGKSLQALRRHLVALGLPASRLITRGTEQAAKPIHTVPHNA